MLFSSGADRYRSGDVSHQTICQYLLSQLDSISVLWQVTSMATSAM